MRRVIFVERRARDSNPQPVARHHISSVTASHSLTLRKLPDMILIRPLSGKVGGLVKSHCLPIGLGGEAIRAERLACSGRMEAERIVPGAVEDA